MKKLPALLTGVVMLSAAGHVHAQFPTDARQLAVAINGATRLPVTLTTDQRVLLDAVIASLRQNPNTVSSEARTRFSTFVQRAWGTGTGGGIRTTRPSSEQVAGLVLYVVRAGAVAPRAATMTMIRTMAESKETEGAPVSAEYLQAVQTLSSMMQTLHGTAMQILQNLKS